MSVSATSAATQRRTRRECILARRVFRCEGKRQKGPAVRTMIPRAEKVRSEANLCLRDGSKAVCVHIASGGLVVVLSLLDLSGFRLIQANANRPKNPATIASPKTSPVFG